MVHKEGWEVVENEPQMTYMQADGKTKRGSDTWELQPEYLLNERRTVLEMVDC